MAAPLNAGDLDKRVTLLRPVYNASEDEITSYEAVVDCWAHIAPESAKEVDEAGRTVALVAVPITIRYRADIDARWRVRHGDQEYEVEGKLDIERLHVQTKLICKEVL